MRITLFKFCRLFFFTLLATCLPNLTFAQDCSPLTGPAQFSFALELAYENYGRACEQRFPEYQKQIAILYPDWKRATAKHIDIGRCHYEQTVAQRPVELRDAIAGADEIMKNGQLEEIKSGATDKAWSPCNWQLRMFKYKPNQ